MLSGGRRGRSVSAPALRLSCANVSRERLRESDVDYERGRDHLAHWLSRWSSDEVFTSELISPRACSGLCHIIDLIDVQRCTLLYCTAQHFIVLYIYVYSGPLLNIGGKLIRCCICIVLAILYCTILYCTTAL